MSTNIDSQIVIVVEGAACHHEDTDADADMFPAHGRSPDVTTAAESR